MSQAQNKKSETKSISEESNNAYRKQDGQNRQK